MHARMNRVACGLQSRMWNRPLGVNALQGKTGASCTGCAVGKQHAKGIVAEGLRIVPKPQPHPSAGTGNRERVGMRTVLGITAPYVGGLRTRFA
jgi:hypothetical protein